IRDNWIGILHRLGVEVIPYVRLFGVDGDSVYLQHTTSGEPVICEGVDTLVLAQGHDSVAGLEQELAFYDGPLHLIGDCLAPPTAEEAVLEGLEVAASL